MIVCPGGIENGGGIGRQMGYFLGAVQGFGTSPSYRLVDSRGPWFLGAAWNRSLLSAGYLLACVIRIAATRFSRTPSIVHINITGRGSTLRKMFVVGAAQCVGSPYLLHVHDYDYAADYFGRGKLQQRLVRRMFHKAKRIIVLGADAKASLQLALALDPTHLAVMHNAVPDPHPNPTPRAAEEASHLLFLGHLSGRKGVPELIAALASPKLRQLNWRATLAGGGETKAYHDMAKQHGISDRIAFPGWLDRPSVEKACQTATCIVLPSHAEGLAMAVLEGLSHGLPVITTPVGAHAEVIETGVSGLLVPPGDITALAESLVKIIEEPDLRYRLQQGARRRFLEEFEIGTYAMRLSNLHAELLTHARTRLT